MATTESNEKQATALDIINMAIQHDLMIDIIPTWGDTDEMRVSFLKRQWFINKVTNECRMEHCHLGRGLSVATDRKDFTTVREMMDYIEKELFTPEGN